MINFKEIEIEGFGSIVKPTKFTLDLGNTLSVIRGDVGSGKTSIPAALCWALFGKHIKEKASIETWEEIKPINYRGTKVVVTFEKDGINYSVIRCKSFKGKITVGKNTKTNGSSNLFFLIGGELENESKGKVNTQENIEKVLGYSFDLFKNSIVFGQKMKRIIEESGPNKKKVFEEAFEVGFIEEAKSNTIAEKDKLQNTVNTLTSEIDKLQDKIDNKDELLENALENEKNFETNKQKRLKDIEDDLQEVIKDLKHYNKQNNDYKFDKSLQSKIDNNLKELQNAKKNNQYIIELEKEIYEIQLDISKHEKVINKKPKLCPSCNQPLSDKGYKSMVASAKAAIDILKGNKTDISKQLLKLKTINILPIENELENLKRKQILQNNNKAEVERVKTKLSSLTVKKNKLESEIKLVKKETIKVKSKVYRKQIKRFEKKLKKLKKENESLVKSLEIKQWLINDPLSNNGLKAYMFDNLLSKVNDRLDDYSKILGFQVEFGIDLETHRKDFYQAIMKEGIIIPYEDLSGGQKQLVDTSVAFAIHDVISELRPTNIMFMDEPFESLGVNEIEVVAELVQEKSKDKSLFLITHHQSFNPINVNEISVRLDENKNTIIE